MAIMSMCSSNTTLIPVSERFEVNYEMDDIVSLLVRVGIDNTQRAWEIAEEIGGENWETVLDEALELAGL